MIAALSLALALAPAFQAAEGAPGSEGALQNDSFLPVSAEASHALAAGDRGWLDARRALERGDRDEAERRLAAAFDEWHGTLAETSLDIGAWWDPSEDGTRRLSEGLAAAVRRRVDGLDERERELWRDRFGDGAEARLALALAGEVPDRGLLAELVRGEPRTAAAARAALVLSDLALEAGSRDRAGAWAQRAMDQARGPGQAELRQAAERRLRALAPPTETPEGHPAWTRARGLEAVGTLRLQGFPGILPTRYLDNPSAGVRPGLAVLDPGRLVVQTPERVHVVRLSPEGEIELESSFEPDDLLDEESVRVDAPRVGPGSPGWALLPAAQGGEMVFVHGRTDSDDNPNALLCLRPADPRLAGPKGRLPSLSWMIVGDLRLRPGAEPERIPELENLASPEFQPGPLLFESFVVVALREAPGNLQGLLAAFDRGTGELLWLRRLAQGSDLVPDRGRFAGRGSLLASQAPLALVSEGMPRLFAGTHLGTGSLLDAVDGELLWTFQNRRRDPSLPGWDGARPLLREEGGLLWAPADSDRVYSLQHDALASTGNLGGLFLHPPQPLGRATVLVGGGADGLLVLGNVGRERALALRRPGQDRIDALYLGPDERFRGEALLSPARVLFSTNRGLYLCDRERELYLLDYAALDPLGSEEPGGTLLGVGKFCLVLGRDGLWSFRAVL